MEDSPLTVLQLDTTFPRHPGDVASPETYQVPITVERIPKASVAKIVNVRPDQYDITPFQDACRNIKTGLGVSSCGFLGYWQDNLAQSCARPFISSALIDLPQCQQHYQDDEMAILTFNEDVLSTSLYKPLLSGFNGKLIGLTPQMHLREVISQDLPHLDHQKAEAELLELLAPFLASGRIKALILECTNLPPYKTAIKSAFSVEIYDILTSIETRAPQAIKPEYL